MPQPLEEIRSVRAKKLEALVRLGVNPYPAKAPFLITDIASVKKSFKKLARSKKTIGAAGRIMAKREHGGSVFIDIFDGSTSLTTSGNDALQLFLGKDKVGENSYFTFLENIDVGDFIAISGKAFYTKRKEPTLEISKWALLSKSLLPLPEKWHGLQDIEERFRKRYLDLLMNKKIRERFAVRSKIVRELRGLLDSEGYVEVETPILQPIYGGALAEPFKTRHRMLDMDMYLRVAPELYLKRLLAAGLSKVYEIGRNFRNEGLDATHNPEFTTVELYTAYEDADYLKKFIVGILIKLIKKVFGQAVFEYDEKKIKFSGNVQSIPFWQVLERYALIPNAAAKSREEFLLRAKQFGLNPAPEDTKEKIANEIFSKICRPKIIQPTYIVDHPIEISPLAKSSAKDPKTVDRFQLIIAGIELLNGFSELNDPLEQKKRLETQEKLRGERDKEAHPMDEDFIEMLEYGMPPAAGFGLSIDRLTMLLTDTTNIKEVILFPTMKPR